VIIIFLLKLILYIQKVSFLLIDRISYKVHGNFSIHAYAHTPTHTHTHARARTHTKVIYI